jgi:hypothetical protein
MSNCRKWFSGGALGLAVSLAAASQASASLLADGDFDGVEPAASQQYYINYSTTIDNAWSILDNNVDVVGAPPSPGPYPPYSMVPPLGISCCSVDLVGDGSGGNKGGIYQTVTLNPGTYLLQLYYANNFYSTGTASANFEIGTTGKGTSNLLLDNVTHTTSTGPTTMDWTLFDGSFTVSSKGPVTVSFDTTFGANSGGVVIADVSLTATPIPPALALFGGGLGLIGLIANRKRRRQHASRLGLSA